MYVTTRQFHSSRDGLGVDQNIVEGLQPGTESDKDLFCGSRIGFIYGDPVKSAHERTVFFKAFVVFFPGCGSYDLEIALGYGRF